uniref:cyclin-dependent kinase 4 inhibitor C isoform X2 n=1 Tax=Scatophagus argus TaxID=75038 RepID=UPI001ED82B8D|nr:cyclin-dependent kinase 4 inhibitor C isoform X2 [Scatophagus argus]
MDDTSAADKLCNASARGDLLEVVLLLQNGVDVNGLNKYNRTALQVVKLANSTLIEALLVQGADPNLRDPACGLTVMHDAAREGFVDSVRVLLDHEADANLADGKGNLPLHLAAREGYLEVVQLLIGHTENPMRLNSQGHTARQVAEVNMRVDIVEYLDSYLNSH